MSTVPGTPPQDEAEKIYWDYSKFDNLTTDEVKKCCLIAINKLIENADTIGKVYWGEAKFYIKERGNNLS